MRVLPRMINWWGHPPHTAQIEGSLLGKLVLLCLPAFASAGKCSYPGGVSVTAAVILQWVTSEFSSTDFQHWLKVSGSPEILQAINTKLGLLKHLASCVVQLPSSIFQCTIITVGLPNTYAIVQSNKPFCNTNQSTVPAPLENPN